MCWVSSLDARTVEEDVNLVPIFQNCGNELRHLILRREITGVDLSFSAEGFNCVLRGWVGGVALEQAVRAHSGVVGIHFSPV